MYQCNKQCINLNSPQRLEDILKPSFSTTIQVILCLSHRLLVSVLFMFYDGKFVFIFSAYVMTFVACTYLSCSVAHVLLIGKNGWTCYFWHKNIWIINQLFLHLILINWIRTWYKNKKYFGWQSWMFTVC